MSQVSKQYQEDAAFREVANLLFGDASDLVSKSNPGPSDVHVSAAAKKRKQEKTQTRIAQASNFVGIGAGVAGTGAALRDDRFKDGGRFAQKLYKTGKKIPSPISGKGGKAGAALAGGALGLQVANIGGDAVTTAVLRRSAKKDKVAKSIPNNAKDSGGSKLTQAKIPSPSQVKGRAAGELVKVGARKLPTKIKTTNDDVTKRAPKVGSFRRIKQDMAATANNARRASEDAAKTSRTVRRATGLAAPVGLAGLGAGSYQAGGKLRKQNTSVAKSADLEIKWEGEISKVNTDRQQVFGWASIVEMGGEPVVDLQGDYISIDEVEKSAYDYVHKSRKGGDMHLRDQLNGADRVIHKSDMIESLVVTPEKKKALGLPDDAPTGWWVGYQVNDPELWAKVKSGERTGFSIHGRGVRS